MRRSLVIQRMGACFEDLVEQNPNCDYHRIVRELFHDLNKNKSKNDGCEENAFNKLLDKDFFQVSVNNMGLIETRNFFFNYVKTWSIVQKNFFEQCITFISEDNISFLSTLEIYRRANLGQQILNSKLWNESNCNNALVSVLDFDNHEQ
eukprot:Pgem_evm1s8802